MSFATTHASPAPDLPRSMPDLERLYELTSVPDARVVMPDVDWAFYERLVGLIPAGANLHVDYDGTDVEIVSPSPFHDVLRKLLAQFVEAVAQELMIPYRAMGQTTWKRPEIVRGLESDECYYFRSDKLDQAAKAMAGRSRQVDGFPNPDLAIEVDVSDPRVDRAEIYAALQVAEVWRCDGERIVIERLGADGTYRSVDSSGFLPVSSQEIARWVIEEDPYDGALWARRLRAWVQGEPTSRKPGQEEP